MGDVGGYGEAATVLRGEAKDRGAGSVRLPVRVDDAERDYDALGGDAGTDKESALRAGNDAIERITGPAAQIMPRNR